MKNFGARTKRNKVSYLWHDRYPDDSPISVFSLSSLLLTMISHTISRTRECSSMLCSYACHSASSFIICIRIVYLLIAGVDWNTRAYLSIFMILHLAVVSRTNGHKIQIFSLRFFRNLQFSQFDETLFCGCC